jgi:ABC-type antimicrobial peptide transport system permease subunit
MPMTQFAGGMVGHAVVVALAAGDPAASLGAIQTRARILDARMAVSELATYPQLLQDSMQTPRLITLLFMVFATSTLLLGCIGVYGVAAFSARERVREIGVRMTLGAHPSSIRRAMLKEGLWLALPGGAIGLVLAAILGRYLRGFLYGVSPVDPVTFLMTPFLLVAAALAAVYLPARRATRIDPARVLREG